MKGSILRWGFALVLGTTVAPVGAHAGADRPEIYVSSTAELYDAVQPENAGSIVHLAPGTYTIEPSRPNAGRLVLPHGMDLIGAKRQQGLESRILVPALGAGPGAILLGDHNVVRWITVEAAVYSYPPTPLGGPFAVGACFDINVLPPTSTGMVAELTDCIAVGATRGIRVQHPRGTANGRSSTIVLERNEARDQGDSFGFAMQIQNAAPDSTIDVSLRKNHCSRGRMGLFVVSLTVNGATNKVRSQGNVYTENVAGIVLDAGRDGASDGGGVVGANRLEFTSIGDVVTDNVGETPDGAAAGGITAIGGLSLSTPARTSAYNQLRLDLRGTTFSGNVGYGVPRDLAVFGGLGVGIIPNGGNRVEAYLDDVTTDAPGTFTFSCSEPAQPTDDPPNDLVVVIDDEPVHVDCD